MKLLFSVTTYIQGDPHFSEEKDDGSATVTDEGKCDSGVGNCVGHNGNVQNDLNRQMSHDPGGEQCPGKLLTMHGDHAEPPEQQGEDQNQDNGTCKPGFFTYN